MPPIEINLNISAAHAAMRTTTTATTAGLVVTFVSPNSGTLSGQAGCTVDWQAAL